MVWSFDLNSVQATNGSGPTAALTNSKEAITAPAKLTATWRSGESETIIGQIPFFAPPNGMMHLPMQGACQLQKAQ
jgi:hypothetical protein